MLAILWCAYYMLFCDKHLICSIDTAFVAFEILSWISDMYRKYFRDNYSCR